MRIFKHVFLFSLLFLGSISTVFAGEPTMVFTVQPTAQDMSTDGTQTLTYTVQNTVPTEPQPLNQIIFTENTTSTTNVTTQTSNTCNNMVPAGGTCNIILKINSGSNSGYVSGVLHVYYSPRNNDLTAPVVFNVIGSAPTATLVYTSQPTTPQTINAGEATTLTYQIKNTSSVAAMYQPSVVTSVPAYMTATITSDPCGGSIAPNQTCNIDVQAIAASVTSTEYDSVDFSVSYGTTHPFSTVLDATPVEFTINVSTGDLTFVPPNPLVPNLAPGQSDSSPLVYTIANGTGSPIAFTAAATSSPYDTVNVTNDCSGSVPASGQCHVSVTRTANSDIAVTTTVYQALDIQYQSTKHLVAPLNYTITVNTSSALTFISSTPQTQSTSLAVSTQPSSPSFTYTLQNSSTTAMPFQASTPNSVTANDSVSFTNTCNGAVPAASGGVDGTCDIHVYIVSTNTPTPNGSPVTHNMNVFFGPNYSYQVSQPFIPTFSVNVNAATSGLVYSLVSAANSQIINGPTQQLLYKVQNLGPTSVPLTAIGITNNSGNTGVSTTSITYSPIPGGDTPCSSNSGASFVTLNAHQVCDFVVNISAPASTSTVGSVTQYVNVSSAAQTITNTMVYNVLNSALSFIAEPIVEDMGQSQTQTIIYGIHNSNSTEAITFNQAGVSYGAYPDTTPVGASLINTTFVNNCNGIVPPNGNCTISATITPTGTGTVKNLALLIPNSSNTQNLLISTFPIDFQITSQAVPVRTLTFTNNCPSTTIWIGLNGGASNNVSSTSAPPNPHVVSGSSSICNTNADCPSGATCVTTNPTTNTKLCYWNSTTPVGGYALASGASTTVTLPEYSQISANDKNTVWSGNVSARTGCSTNGLCQTADCSGASTTVTTGVNEPNSTQACLPGTGSSPPDTLAEFTLSRASADFYDVSIINGANIPISMRPTSLTAYQTTQNGFNGYICGEGGKTTATANGPGAASWSFTPPTTPPATQFANVLYNASKTSPCTSNSACNAISSGDICGLTFNPNTNTFRSQCGQFLGYWTGDQICGTSNGAGASSDFNCSQNAGMSNFPSATVANLYKCDVGIPSCYNNPTGTNQCCGCANWDSVPSVGALVPAAPLVEACPATTPTNTTQWNTLLQVNGAGSPNNMAWLKAAVPSAYTYPYDDPSSTFTCPNCATGAGQPAGTGCSVPSTEFNTSNYTITFCPGSALIPQPT